MRTTKLITFVGFLAISLLPLNASADITCKTDYWGTTKCKDSVNDTNQQKRIERAEQYGKQMRQGLGGLLGTDTRTTSEKAQAAQRETLKQEQEHAKRLREIEYQRKLIELKQLKASSNASKPAPRPRAVNYSSAEQDVTVICRGTSDAGFPTISAVVGSSCPAGKVKVN
ncbi:hypothetical protein OAC12_05195 [Porticoccaceae bacterium]|nr:hypothetical protein [Porticoccaceae bacterium]